MEIYIVLHKIHTFYLSILEDIWNQFHWFYISQPLYRVNAKHCSHKIANAKVYRHKLYLYRLTFLVFNIN